MTSSRDTTIKVRRECGGNCPQRHARQKARKAGGMLVGIQTEFAANWLRVPVSITSILLQNPSPPGEFSEASTVFVVEMSSLACLVITC